MKASKLPVLIHVSKKDITKAKLARAHIGYRAPQSCPIAQALRQGHSTASVKLSSTEMFGVFFIHSDAIVGRIRAFDDSNVMEPFTLRIDPRRKTISVA